MRDPAARARRRRRAGPHVPRRRAAPAALLLAAGWSAAAPCPSCWKQGAAGRAAAARAGRRHRPDGAARPRRRDRVGEGQPGRARRTTRSRSARRAARPPARPSRWPRSTPAYEALKTRPSVLDFEDLLLHTAAALEEHARRRRGDPRRYRYFVVDEYQDVTPLQQRLLDAWLGGRDDLTVVGDANQTIYSFAGATPRYLLDFPRRFPRRGGGPAGPRLPLDPAGGRAGQPVIGRPAAAPAGTRLRAGRAAAAGPGAGVRRATPTSRPRRPRWRRAVARADRRRHAGQRDRGAVPDQRPVRGVRAGARRGRGAVRGARRRAVLRAARGAAGDDRAAGRARRPTPARAAAGRRRRARRWPPSG